jgi:nicotinate-nucleotide adenylyltransferase
VIRALFGGSFDPIHAGHVAIVDLLLDRGLATVVHVAPAWRSPHKLAGATTPAQVRLELVRLALADRPHAVVEDREIRRRGSSFTVTTLAGLAADHPGDRWRLVIGADQAAAFRSWREPERLLALAEPVVVARGPLQLDPLLAGRALIIDDFAHPASGTAIRGELARGRLPGPELLPPDVAARIQAAGLYGYRAAPAAPREDRT